MFGTIMEATQGSSQNTGFEIFEQNTGISNLGRQSFGNTGGGSSLIGNNNFNNSLSVNLFRNLGENNFNNLLPLSSPVNNLFKNIGGGNPSPNNNNPLPEGLNSNVAALVNALTEMNLMGGHYLKKGSFIKPTEFGELKLRIQMNG